MRVNHQTHGRIVVAALPSMSGSRALVKPGCMRETPCILFYQAKAGNNGKVRTIRRKPFLRDRDPQRLHAGKMDGSKPNSSCLQGV